MSHIPIPFLGYAADILGETNRGLTGSEIVKAFNAYAVEYGVQTRHAQLPFDASNKRVAILENLQAFPSPLQYKIINELIEHRTFAFKKYDELKTLKQKLVSQFSHLAPKDEFSKLNESLTEETRHWLDRFPLALDLYLQALQKYKLGTYSRNLLDDLRLSLELLLNDVFKNNKSLENQLGNVGQFVSKTGGSTEFSNMFVKLMDYYGKYQNTYIKHDDAVIEEEVEFIFEITSSFMRHIIRLNVRSPSILT
jgi:hypothetical protein